MVAGLFAAGHGPREPRRTSSFSWFSRLVALLVTAVVLVRRPFPQTSGELELKVLDSKVEVVRDEHGIPQVYADSTADLMRAQGFVQAQDRFFEMDVRRHVTAGRLSELFGRTR